MMLTVTTAAVASFAFAVTAAEAPAARPAEMPPMIVTVTSVPGMSQPLVNALLDEAATIWRAAGVSFVWRRATPEKAPAAPSATAPSPNTLRLTIGDNRGVGSQGHLPLGWIVFDDATVPAQEIYLSFSNAQSMLYLARGVVGVVDQMPLAQRDTLLARAMGRALAHELGHYLLASKIHTPSGLMKATLSATELFMATGAGLRIEPAQRRLVAARLRGEPMVASR
jgi:hypothetical protein